jgi:hypothetical protein
MNNLLKEIEKLNKKRNIKAKKAKKIIDIVEKRLKKAGIHFSMLSIISSRIYRKEDSSICLEEEGILLCENGAILKRYNLWKEVVEQAYKEAQIWNRKIIKNRYFIHESSFSVRKSDSYKEIDIFIAKHIDKLLEAVVEKLKKEEANEDQD